MYCGDASLVKRQGETLRASAIRCRSWHCQECYPLRKARLIAEAIGGKPNTFLTLTTRRVEGKNFPEAVKELTRAWRLVRLIALREGKRDRRKSPHAFGGASPFFGPYTTEHPEPRRVHLIAGKLEFLAVIEKHKSGWPHLHLLLRSQWIDFWWLQATWKKTTGAHRVQIERLKSRSRSAAYCAKYCGKVRDEIIGAKRYWKTRDYEQRPRWRNPPAAAPWTSVERDPRTLDRIVSSWLALGYLVERASKFLAYAQAPPDGLHGSQARQGGRLVAPGVLTGKVQ